MSDRAARLLAALLVVAPVGALAWGAVLYLLFGLTGEDAPRPVTWATALGCGGGVWAWVLRGGATPAGVVARGARLGIAVALLLPVVAVAVLLLWQHVPGRRDLGMGGLMLYNVPLVALAMTLILVPIFWGVMRLAQRRLPVTGAP